MSPSVQLRQKGSKFEANLGNLVRPCSQDFFKKASDVAEYALGSITI